LIDIELPDDMLEALQSAPDAKSRFDRLPKSHRTEYLKWVLGAKSPDTRARRISGMVERLGRATET
jgi:uncharacterized protein YdeI (YjbR/CyaY-like superfamily)